MSQDAILAAISAGNRRTIDIARAVNMSVDRIRTPIGRLILAGRVERRGAAHAAEYVAVGHCLLDEAWALPRTFQPIKRVVT